MHGCPNIIGGAKVILYTSIDGRHHFTGNCKQLVAGRLTGPMAALAICQYDGDNAYYLFGCDKDWNSITDSWHQDIEEAIDQAEFEYEGSRQTWNENGTTNHFR
jgi:hypothetical protein